MDEFILKIAQEILVFGILNSIITYGIITSVERWMGKTNQTGDTIALNAKVKIILTYVLGFCWFSFLQLTPENTGLIGKQLFVAKAALGLFIGVASVAMYSVAVKGVLELVPCVFDAVKLIISSWGQGIANKVNAMTPQAAPQAAPVVETPTPEKPLIPSIDIPNLAPQVGAVIGKVMGK